VQHLSGLPAERFALGRRGTVATGAVADLVLVDPATVADTATYAEPRRAAVGIDDVFVAGVPVLVGAEPTGALPGRGLRRDRSEPNPGRV
jgi:N-acyl-D-amino-acid deacylase